jgi:hypothetical protein
LLLMLAVAAIFVFVPGDGGTPMHPSDLSEWRQVEAESLPVVAEVSLNPKRDQLHVSWSPDGTALAWLQRIDDLDTLSLYRLGQPEPNEIALLARSLPDTLYWSAEGKSVHVGVYPLADYEADMQRTDLRQVYVEHLTLDGIEVESISGIVPSIGEQEFFEWLPARSLRQYDVETGHLVDEQTAADLWTALTPEGESPPSSGGLNALIPSPDGTRMLLKTDSNWVVHSRDKTPRVLGSAWDDGWDEVQWCADGKGVLSLQYDYNPLMDWLMWAGVFPKPKILYRSLDNPTRPTTVTKLGSFSEGFQAYSSESSFVRFTIEDGGLLNWDVRIQEYHFTKDTVHTTLDVKALFDGVYGERQWMHRETLYPTRSPDRMFAIVLPHELDGAETWLIQLERQRVLARLPLPDATQNLILPSPDGRKVAVVNENGLLRVYDLDAVLAE